MKCFRCFCVVLISVVFVAGLSACGGGVSSSGGGSRAAGTSFVGTYAGAGNLVITAPGVPAIFSPFLITIIINPDNTVLLDPFTPYQGMGTITGNTITAAYPAAIANSPGVSCTGVIAVSGIVLAPPAGGGGATPPGPTVPGPTNPAQPPFPGGGSRWERNSVGAPPIPPALGGLQIMGTLGPSVFTCNGTPFTIEGTFTASKVAKAPLQGFTLGDELREAVRESRGQ